ncbi:MAG: hypothetical protein K6F75_03345 [Butyrivibrio sp.]|nr:hypothetical protein [Butyrivibrio sp.]
MNKNDFKGFKQVFLFEFMTGVKKPAFLVTLAIICIMGLVTTPIMTIVGNLKDDGADDKKKSAIESVYVYDETGLSIDYEAFTASEKYSDVSFITDTSMTYDQAVESLSTGSDHKDIVMKTEYDTEKGFDVTILRSEKSGIKGSDLDKFEEDYSEFLRNEILKGLEVSDENYEYMSKEFNITVMKPSKDGSFAEDSETLSLDDYFKLLGGLLAVFLLINMSAGNVSSSIATEKSSRVIEFLLTGTRPVALLSGKIAARLLETFITVVSAYSSIFLSQVISLLLPSADTASASTGTSDNVIMVSSFWETITASRLIVALLYFLAGLALFTVIGALAGASVSKIDELQDALKFYSFLLLICLYTDFFLVMYKLYSGGLEGFKNFCALFPLTGAFLTPALLLTGNISTLLAFIALILLVIAAVVTFIFAAAVYESMLLYQGKRLKAKDIITLMKKQVVT